LKNVTDPYFFVAECSEDINHLEIYDHFLQNDTVDKVYFINYLNETTTFAGKGEFGFNLTVGDDFSRSPVGESWSSLFLRYLKLGLEHILSGPDHIAFILGYILLAVTFGGLLKGITGFTTSHSATLTLAALGILVVPAKIVEPLIAVSIVVVALLSLLKKAQGWLIRFGVIFLFGLFHGLGFAGSIAEVGFPKEGFLAALLGFSMGIELGQLLIVAVIFPLLWYGDKKFPSVARKVRWGLAGIIMALGTFWVIQRLFFA
jgi:hydrogenase/urease accessory protein HupE